MRLRDGTEVDDPRLGRLIHFDPRSRNYPILAQIDRTKPRSYTWNSPFRLDQGYEGACVGFAWAHELGARPKPQHVDEPLAHRIYRLAQYIDEWAGEDYEGTSVLAGAKVVQQLGGHEGYSWAFNLNEALTGISRHGPAVLGVNWHTGMLDTDSEGYIHPTGEVVGGHAILATGVSLKRQAVRLNNSWGPAWGMGGQCFISFDDLGKLLADYGECCFPVGRRIMPVDG